jgi:hypothetical protein
MSTQLLTDERVRSSLLLAVEAAYWIAVVTAGIVAVGSVPAVATGGGLMTLKYFLFVVGFLLFGIGSFAIQPKSPRLGDKSKFRQPVARIFSMSLDGDEAFRFEKLIQRLPPLRDRTIALEHRVSRNTKLFLTSLVVLGVSFFMEAVLGVTV